jgi:hypothetical protein
MMNGVNMMKKIVVPHGKTFSYSSLHAEKVIVYGTLRVHGKLTGKQIIGGGVIEAGEIICNELCVSCVTAGCATARKIAADKLFVRSECRASEQIAVRDYLTAGYVSTGTLSVSLSDVVCCDADKIIMVRQRGSLLGLLWASWWRSLFINLFHGEKTGNSNQEALAGKEKAA